MCIGLTTGPSKTLSMDSFLISKDPTVKRILNLMIPVESPQSIKIIISNYHLPIRAKVLEIRQDAVAMIGRVQAHKIYRKLIKGFQTKPIKH